MPIQTACPGCGKLLSVADEYAGKKARCPACGTVFTVPPQSIAAQTSPAPVNPFQGQVPNPASQQAVFPAASNALNGTAQEGIGQEGIGQEGIGQAAFPQTDEMFWMRAVDGSIYGPTDRENLNRWFREGRVGAGYQIRQGESGLWEDAAIFRPASSPMAGFGGTATSTNPYAAQSSASMAPGAGTPLHKYPKADRGVIVLVMGILSFAICFVFGIVAIVMGKAAMNDISAGLANPNDKPLVQIGFWLGVASLIINVAVIGFFVLMIALSAANQI